MLEAYRQRKGAVPWSRLEGGLRLEGVSDQLGVAGDYSLIAAADGRFRTEIRSTVGNATMHDGTTTWHVDWTGIAGAVVLHDAFVAALATDVHLSRWAEPNAPYDVTVYPAGGDSSGGDSNPCEDALPPGWTRLRLHRRDSLLCAELMLDADLRARRLRLDGLEGTLTHEFDDYRDSNGMMLAHEVREMALGQVVQRVRIHSIEAVRAFTAADFAPPPPPDDTRFDANALEWIPIQRAQTGHLVVPCRLDQNESAWFVFDSGAGESVIAPATAARLGWSAVGHAQLMSIFGHELAAVRRGTRIEVGRLRIEQPTFVEMNLDFFTAFVGHPVDGIIGYDVLARARVEVDLAGDRLSVRDPAEVEHEPEQEPVVWRPLLLHRHHPVFPARFEGDHEGLFRLDLGAGGGPFANVMMHAPAVSALGLLENRSVEKKEQYTLHYASGHLEWFELAGHRFEHPEVAFSMDTIGPGADPYVMGNIGLAFLLPFRILFDYPHRRLALVESFASEG